MQAQFPSQELNFHLEQLTFLSHMLKLYALFPESFKYRLYVVIVLIDIFA